MQSLSDRAPHFFNRAFELVLTEERRASDKCIGSGAGALSGSGVVNATVYGDAVREAVLFSPYGGLLHLGQCFRDETLPAETWIYGHDQ